MFALLQIRYEIILAKGQADHYKNVYKGRVPSVFILTLLDDNDYIFMHIYF